MSTSRRFLLTLATLVLTWLPPAMLAQQPGGASMFVESPGSATRPSAGAIAAKLNTLGQSLSEAGTAQDEVATFLMRSVFSCFAEDLGLIRKESFHRILAENKAAPDRCVSAISALWKTMQNAGGGWLFETPAALPLSQKQIALLAEVADADWSRMDTTVFGSILENALAATERKQLGTHYTPAAYVERLVIPTIIAPLRDEWAEVDKTNPDAVKRFHSRLCAVVILDPACGSGNFLATSFELLNALDAEVLAALHKLGQAPPTQGISIQQFRGIEIAPHSADVCELVLRVCWLRAYCNAYKSPPSGVDNQRVVECRDALLKLDGHGGFTAADPWPRCEFIVGNPPFVGAYKMRKTLGDPYTESLRKVYGISGKADLVMFWWHRAASLVRDGDVHRFGFIVTQGVRNKYNSAVVGSFLDASNPVSIVYAIPDHPWLMSGAGVRIAMTVCAKGDDLPGTLATVVSETPTDGGYGVSLNNEQGIITPMLTLGADLTKIKELRANDGLCGRGVMLSGRGFVITAEQAKNLGLGTVKGLEEHIHPLCNGRDLTGDSRDVLVLDMTGMSENDVKQRFPAAYKWLEEHVKPLREKNRDEDLRQNWWLFSSTKDDLRKKISELPRYIATSKTMQRRFFTFLNSEILPDDALTIFASDDAYLLGVLSSRSHCAWAAATGSRLIDVLRYDKTRCFDSFPFPEATDVQKAHIREIAEKLDAHRKERQKKHSNLKLAEMYAVLEKLQRGEQLTSAERQTSNQGDLPTLQKLHAALDAAVIESYGWPPDIKTPEIISRLFDLNQKRADEEITGKVQWIRPPAAK